MLQSRAGVEIALWQAWGWGIRSFLFLVFHHLGLQRELRFNNGMFVEEFAILVAISAERNGEHFRGWCGHALRAKNAGQFVAQTFFLRGNNMAVDLLIRDGDPHWYLSPDIWVVPGADPDGPIGSPVAGQPAYLWARVFNNGGTQANGVRVDFYWANPALQVTRSNATFVGSAFADVPAGESQDALCLVPWMPVIVNDGHECLVAVANHPAHALPSPLPDAFEPVVYPQVAQKNLTVLNASAMKAFMFALTVSALPRVGKQVTVTVEEGKPLDEKTLLSLGLRGYKPARKANVEVGLSTQQIAVCDKQPIGERALRLEISKGTSAAVHVGIRASDMASKEYHFIHIVERAGDEIIGGLGFVVVGQAANVREIKE